MLFILCALIGSKNYDYESNSEGYNTLNPSDSPAIITLDEGLALMMVEWPDAIIKISIPDILSKPITLTKDVGLSLFTFKNKATIEMNFKTKTTFSVAHCPQIRSISGAIQSFSNYNNNAYTGNEINKDLYYSFYGPYAMKGSMKVIGRFSSAKLIYHPDNVSLIELKDLNTFSIPNAMFTSSFIRNTPTCTLEYNLVFNTSLSFKATVLTAVDLHWSSVSANKNNYLDNYAYGGKKDQSNYKESKISDILYQFQLTAKSQIGATFGYQINNQEIKTVSGTLIKGNDSPFTLNLYVKYKNCKEFTKIKTYSIVGPNQINIELNDKDIPNECKADSDLYKVCFIINDLPNVYKFGYKVSNDPSDQIKQLTNDPIVAQSQFDLTLYLISSPSGCSNIELKKYQSSKTFECVSLTESIIPDKCKLMYYVKIQNNINLIGIKLYAKDRNSKYVEISNNYEDSFSSPFVTSIYITSSICQDHKLVNQISSITDSSVVNKIDNSLVPMECLPDGSKTYSVRIQNKLTSRVANGRLYVEDRNGNKIEIEKGKIYEEMAIQKEPFSVKIYVSSLLCAMQNIATIVAKENPPITIYDDSIFPSQCLAYSVCLQSNIPSGYSFGYSDLSEEHPSIKPISGTVQLSINSQFVVQIYLIASPNCETNRPLFKYTAQKNIDCKILTLNDVPNECKADSDLYKVCFIINDLPNVYKFGYKVSNDPSDQIKQLTNDPIVAQSQFDLTLYLISSPSGCSNIELKKYQSSKTFECVSLTESIIPDKCKLKYYIKFKNQITSRSYSVFAKNRNNEFVEIEDLYEDSYSEPFQSNVYIKSSACQNYTLSDGGSFDSWTDPTKVVTIPDYFVPEKCLIEGQIFYVAAKYGLSSSDYKLYAENRNNQLVEITPSNPYKDQYTLPFITKLYITSPLCSSPTMLEVYIFCGFLENDYLVVNDSYIPSICLKPVKYKICADLSNLPKKYEISYTKSFDTGMNIATYGNNTITYNHPFSINAYLTKSPKCSEQVYLGKFNAAIDFKCIIVTADLLPEECRDADDSSVKNKSVSIPMVAGISAVALIVIAIIIGIIIFVSKRKQKANQFNSDTLGSNLLSENNQNQF